MLPSANSGIGVLNVNLELEFVGINESSFQETFFIEILLLLEESGEYASRLKIE
jgi:RNAse (barnase) inhibitor barstar